MAMDPAEIARMIKEALPDASVEVEDYAGDGDHFRATIVSEAFRGKTRVQQHRLINDALAGKLGGDLHALTLQCSAPE
ncbi:MAG: BolA family transcriptional regulator [Hyphomicrobiaceae bacterium]|nr:BolA family transcriptional regulator [Hyphomicrobiaceae bacterium]